MTLPIAGSLTTGSHMASENFEILIIKYPAVLYSMIHLAVLCSPVYKIRVFFATLTGGNPTEGETPGEDGMIANRRTGPEMASAMDRE